MDVSVRKRQSKAEANRLMHKSYFAQFAFEARRMSALPRNQLGRPLLGRSNASAWRQPGSAHWSGKTSLKGSGTKRNGASRKLAPNFTSISRISDPDSNYDTFSRFIFPVGS